MFTPSWSQHTQPLSCLLEAEGRNLVELGAAGQKAGKLQPAAHVDPVTPPAPHLPVTGHAKEGRHSQAGPST